MISATNEFEDVEYSESFLSEAKKESALMSCLRFLTCQKKQQPEDLSKYSSIQGEKVESLVVSQQSIGKTHSIDRETVATDFRYKDMTVMLSRNKGFAIVAKESQRSFQILNDDHDYRMQMGNFFKIARLNQQVNINQSDLEMLAPESVAKYIAWRCKGAKLILDVSSGGGLYSIQFSDFVSYVTNIAEDKEDSNRVRENLKAYKREGDIDVVCGSFPQLNICKGTFDIIFLDLTLREKYKRFSEYFSKALKLCKNIIVLLPANFRNSEIASAYGNIKQEWSHQYYSVEIENIVINQKTEYKILFTGTFPQISQMDFHYTLCNYIFQDGKKAFRHDFSSTLPLLLANIEARVGIYQLLFVLAKSHYPSKKNTIQRFIKEVQSQNILSLQEMKTIRLASRQATLSFQTFHSDQSYHLASNPIQSKMGTNQSSTNRTRINKGLFQSSDPEKHLQSKPVDQSIASSQYIDSFSHFTGESFNYK